MIKNGILSIVFAALILFGVIPHVNATTFTLNSISITDFDENPGVDNALDIVTDATGYVPYTTSDLSVGEWDTFDLFYIWTGESQVTFGEDDIEKTITVAFDFSMPVATGGPINGITKGYVSGYGTVIYPWPVGEITDYLNDEGQVTWLSSADFSFGGDGIFRITLSPTSFNQGIPTTVPGQGGQWTSLYGGIANGSIVEATLLYVQAPTVVPVPPAIILLGTGILGIAGIRRKFKK